MRGFAAIDGNPQVLLCDPWAGENDFDCETAVPLDDFMVAWDNVALLMRQRTDNTPRSAVPGAVHGCVRWAPMPPVFTGFTSTARSIPCRRISVRRAGYWPTACPMPAPYATTAHRSFVYTEPTDGGIMLEHGDTARKYTVYAIETDGRMIVGDVTV